MSKSSDFNLRNYGITILFLLLTGVVGSVYIATRQEVVSGIRTDYYEANNLRFAKNQIVTTYRPNPWRWHFAAIASACLYGVVLTLKVELPTKNKSATIPLVDLDTIGVDFTDTLTKSSLAIQANGLQLLGASTKRLLSVGQKTGRFVHLRLTPTPVRDLIDDIIHDRTWLSKLLKKHVLFAGKTRQGKTMMVKYAILEYVKQYPTGWLRICDPNYGKRGIDGEEPNTWMDLPLEYISGADPSNRFDDIFSAVRSEYDDLRKRMSANAAYARGKQKGVSGAALTKLEQDAVCIPSLLVLDEFPSIVAEAKRRGTLADFLDQIQELLTQGLSYNKRLYLLAQSTAVNMIELELSKQDQLCKCLIQDVAERKRELTDIGVEDSALVRSKVKALRRKGHRVAVVDIGESDPRIQIIPNLSWIGQVSFRLRNPTLEWWESYYVHNPENQAWLADRAKRVVAGEKGVSPLSSNNRAEIMQRFGGMKTDNTDPRYANYFKIKWKQLVESAQNP
jgi:hypothetical protein